MLDLNIYSEFFMVVVCQVFYYIHWTPIAFDVSVCVCVSQGVCLCMIIVYWTPAVICMRFILGTCGGLIVFHFAVSISYKPLQLQLSIIVLLSWLDAT